MDADETFDKGVLWQQDAENFVCMEPWNGWANSVNRRASTVLDVDEAADQRVEHHHPRRSELLNHNITKRRTAFGRAAFFMLMPDSDVVIHRADRPLREILRVALAGLLHRELLAVERVVAEGRS